MIFIVGTKFWVSVDGLMPQLDYLQVLLILKESEKLEAKKYCLHFHFHLMRATFSCIEHVYE
jgi:hypothetical protein